MARRAGWTRDRGEFPHFLLHFTAAGRRSGDSGAPRRRARAGGRQAARYEDRRQSGSRAADGNVVPALLRARSRSATAPATRNLLPVRTRAGRVGGRRPADGRNAARTCKYDGDTSVDGGSDALLGLERSRMTTSTRWHGASDGRASARSGCSTPRCVRCRCPPTPQGCDPPVLHRDAHVLVVDKPPGYEVSPAKRLARGSMVNGAVAHVGHDVYPAHRLDRDTSGCLCFALDKASARAPMPARPSSGTSCTRSTSPSCRATCSPARIAAISPHHRPHLRGRRRYVGAVDGAERAAPSSACRSNMRTSLHDDARARDERGNVVLAAPRQADDGGRIAEAVPRPLRVHRSPDCRRRAVQGSRGTRRDAAAGAPSTRCGCGCRIPTLGDAELKASVNVPPPDDLRKLCAAVGIDLDAALKEAGLAAAWVVPK